jgi:hypothetical protein
MATNLDEMIEFLSIASNKGFINDNTAYARRTACKKFFDILDPDQKTVEYVGAHLDVIKARFSNLNKDVAGATVEEYARRVQLVINDFTAWKQDRAGWEKSVSAKQSARPAADAEKKPRTSRVEKVKETVSNDIDAATRVVSFPLRKDLDVSVTLPRDGITSQELQRLGLFLLPYVSDFNMTSSGKVIFPGVTGPLSSDADAV